MIKDLVIIGAGPGGVDAAEYAAQNGLNVTVIEKNNLGGVCLNEGCIPTKTLLNSAHILEKFHTADKYALSASKDVSIDMDKLMKRKTKILRKLSAGIKQNLTKNNVEIINAEAKILERKENGNIIIQANEDKIEAKYLIIATGSETIIPPIKGLDDKVWTSKEALENTEKINELLVVGAGVIGIEFASFFASIGVKVTVVEMQGKILGNMDSEISEELQKALSKKGIKFYLSSKLESVVGNIANVLDSEGNKLEIPFDKLLLSIGRKANAKGLGVENIGIEPDKRGAINVDSRMKTSVDNVYAIGDVNGVSMLAHTASREGVVAVDNILGISDSIMSYDAIPGIIYGDPEVACVGKTEDELIANNTPYNVKKVPMALSGRFVIENEMSNGLCKVITDKNDVILGVHIIGNTSSEILTPAIIAIEKKMTIKDLKNIVFPHPTISEIIKTALFVH